MKHFKTLLLLSPFSLLAQNIQQSQVNLNILSNVSYNYNGNRNINVSNISNQINYRSNNNVYANTNVSRRNTVVVFNNGSPVQTQSRRVTTTRRQVVNTTTANRQVRRTQQNNVNPVAASQQNKVPATTNIQNNVSISNQRNVDFNFSNLDNNEDIQQVIANPVKNEVQQMAVQVAEQVQSSGNKSVQEKNKGGEISMSGIKLPKFSFEKGRSKSSGASHHAKKHNFKKFWIKTTRKVAAKHGGKKKHFILDKCAQWFR